jgi:predicted esterase
MGFRMPGWYDIYELSGKPEDLRANQDEKGILESRDYFKGLIQSEIDAGIPADRIVLGGFSQGGAMALFAGLTGPVRLAGIVGLSSYLPLDSKFPEFLKQNDFNKATPILMCHGTADGVVPTALGKDSSEFLKKLGFDVTMKLYPYVFTK